MSAYTADDLSLVWDAAKSSPFQPFIPQESQFLIAITLLASATLLTGVFALNQSIATLPILGVPASLAFGFGAVYMICAVGVYV